MVLFSLLGAILVIFKEVNPIRYNIEFVSTLIIAYTCVFGWYALIPTYIFVAIEQILYGFNIWTYFYLYAWAILVLISFPFRKLRSPILWAMIAGVFGLSFGALSAITSYFIGGWGAAVAYWTSGLWFDLTHCVGNFIITLLLCYPLRILLEKGKETLKI
ncbi:MAG: hypothetical protein A2Y15_00755 [Clostridiales bacterium GWF2_36_10]|nr:MAG: hypothetical protein A2Y15_00755 [Clostridiales bacterium GWF2_36_10]